MHASVVAGGTFVIRYAFTPEEALQVDIAPGVVFLTGSPRSEGNYALNDANGGRTSVALPARTDPKAPLVELAAELHAWARGLLPNAWRAILSTQLPLRINGEVHLDVPTTLTDPYSLLISSTAPDDGSVAITIDGGTASVQSRARLTTRVV